MSSIPDTSLRRGGGVFWFHLVMVALSGLLVLFVIAPLLGMILSTTPAGLKEAAGRADVRESFGLTLGVALAATLICSLFGIPLAYLFARKRFPGRALLLALIDLPVIVPHSVAGIALLCVLGRKTAAGGVLESLGLGITGSALGVGVAMAFVSVPFLVNAAREGFAAVPERLERAARTLGASPTRVFFTIALPMCWRPILSGMTMMWARGISEFGAVIIIAYHPMTATVKIYEMFTGYGLSNSRPAAVLLLMVCVAIFLLLRWLSASRRRERGADA